LVENGGGVRSSSDPLSNYLSPGKEAHQPPLPVCYVIYTQCFYYLAMGTSIGVLHAVFQTSITLDHFFTPNYIDMTTLEGWAEAACIWISSLVG
jgi:hypothetical protein